MIFFNPTSWLDNIALVASILTPIVIGCLGIKMQKASLNQSKYDRRFAIFSKARDAMEKAILTKPGEIVDRDALEAFRLATIESGFLFKPEVEKALSEIHSKILLLSAFESADRIWLYKGSSEETEEIRLFLWNSFDDLEALFKPSLHFTSSHRSIEFEPRLKK